MADKSLTKKEEIPTPYWDIVGVNQDPEACIMLLNCYSANHNIPLDIMTKGCLGGVITNKGIQFYQLPKGEITD